ncbi:MAG: RusA family crossover junction endodeoxyribonuclease [Firmicutes bacterium]|nr:RusA family crossover junction endodeoxyribonuclease [Bacillota bacterium]
MKFTVPEKPHGKDRPRFRKIGNYVSTYNTKATTDYEKLVKLSALEQCKDQLDREYSGPVKMSIKAYFKPNKSISKKQYNLLIGQAHLKKPDSDNIAKIICDSLNKIAYHDDSQIYDLHIEKYYNDQERVEVEIEYE